MAEAAQDTGRVLSEGFAYRYHPITARMRNILASGEIGKVRHIEAQFCFLLPQPKNIRFQYKLAGGALMDAGCYPVSLIRFLAQAEPVVTNAKARLFAPQVDSHMEASMNFADGRTAHLVCDMLSSALFRSFAHVRGDEGELRVINPFHPHWFNWLEIRNHKGTQREWVRGENIYVYQLRAFAQAIHGETKLSTDSQDTLGNMRVIDAIYEKAGLNHRGTE
jgi:predicted dehydrogenase